MSHFFLGGDMLDNGLIRSSIRLKVPLAKQNEVIDILHSISEQIKSEPDCIYAYLYRGVNDAEMIMFEELWKNQKALNSHIRSRLYQRILVAIEMSKKEPDIRFDKIIESRGFETLIHIRAGHNHK